MSADMSETMHIFHFQIFFYVQVNDTLVLNKCSLGPKTKKCCLVPIKAVVKWIKTNF